MKKNNVVEELKEIPIPEYEELEDLLECSECRYCKWHSVECSKNSDIDSRYSCYCFREKIELCKLILLIIVLISTIIYNCVNFSTYGKSVLNTTIISVGFIFVDYISDVILEKLFLYLEERRNQNYDLEVEEISKKNKQIRKKLLGTSDEFENFVDNSETLFTNLKNNKEEIKNLYKSPSDVEKSICKKYERLLKQLEDLNEKLSMNNFEDSTIAPIYNVYLPKLVEDSNYLIELSNSGKLTEKQELEFLNLLDCFIKKLQNENLYLDNKLEEDFIIKMEALRKDLLPEYNGGNYNE